MVAVCTGYMSGYLFKRKQNFLLKTKVIGLGIALCQYIVIVVLNYFAPL